MKIFQPMHQSSGPQIVLTLDQNYGAFTRIQERVMMACFKHTIFQIPTLEVSITRHF